jgi:hypothetical protein
LHFAAEPPIEPRTRLRSGRSSGIVIAHAMGGAMRTARFAWLISAALAAGFSATSHSARAESDAELEAGRIAHDHVLCRKYGGYEEGTDEFKQCLDAMAKRRADAAADAKAKRRQASSQSRALSAAENSACSTRSAAINDGGAGTPMAHEGGVGTCGH